MDTRVLENFLIIAEKENITSAAQCLHISQSTLSRQMAELEREIGKPLFTRTNKNTTLNENGQLFRERAEEMVSLMNRTFAEFQSTEQTLHGEIHIGAGESPVIRYVAETIREFHEKYPQVRFHMHSSTGDICLERLKHGIFDLGILIEPKKRPEFEYKEIPVQDTFGILLRKDSPLAQSKSFSPADLAQMPLIISQRPILIDKLKKWLQSSPVPVPDDLNVTVYYNLLYNASLLAQAGVGNVLCPNSLADTFRSDLLCFRPLEPEMHMTQMLVWKKSLNMSRANELFLEALQRKFDSAAL